MVYLDIQNFSKCLSDSLKKEGQEPNAALGRNSLLLNDFLQLKIIYIVGILLALSLILSALGVLAYRLSLKLIYGSFIQKLEDMIADMNELSR